MKFQKFAKTPVVIWLCASSLLTGGVLLPASAKNTNKQQLIQQMAQAQIAVQQDNEKLRAIMKTTLEAFKKYCHKTRTIPQTERHTAYLERSLSELAGANPFENFPFRIAADDEDFRSAHDTTGGDRHKSAVLLRYDTNLNATQTKNWQKNKPENWIEMPGSITILHDGHNFCCVWGAGVDGYPIRVDDQTANSDYFVLTNDHVAR